MNKEKNESIARKNQMMLQSGVLMPEGEKLRRELAQGFAPFEAYRDEDLEKLYEELPYKIYYYNEDRLDEKTRQLLFGTGTAPSYDEDVTGPSYPFHTAPVYESQLQHNVSKPNRYDYISKWNTMMV